MGSLSPGEARLLVRYIEVFKALESGERAPATAMQHHFVCACRGEVPARTKYEKAYLRWRELGVPQTQLEVIAAALESRKQLVAPAKRVRSGADREREKEIKRRAEMRKIERQAAARLEGDLARQRKAKATRVVQEWGTRDDFRADRASWKRGGR